MSRTGYNTVIRVHRGGKRGPPESKLFYPSPRSSAAEKSNKKWRSRQIFNLTGKAPKIGGFRPFFAKMAEFTAIWRAFSYITFYPPPPATLTVHMYEYSTQIPNAPPSSSRVISLPGKVLKV